MAVTILILGLLFSVNASPILDQSGFRDVIVAINDNVPQEKGSALIQSIKDLMTDTSEMMYFSSMTRFYIKEVTILTPKTWSIEKVPEIAGYARHGEVYEHASIKVNRMDTEHGDAPYTHQPGHCGEEGNPVLISDDYLINLMEMPDEMVLKYGPIGKVLTQEFTKYRYGIFEEYGYPGTEKNGEVYPSTYTEAFRDRDGLWKMALVNNTCSDTTLDGKLLHIEGEKEESRIVEGCDTDIDEETGEIVSDSCFFAANSQNEAFSSMGSYQYTDLVSVFCDHEYFQHNHVAVNKHNNMCLDETRDWEPMSTWTTILKHTDFDYGHNEGGYVDSTVPSFIVYKQPSAKFVLVLDNSNSMSSCSRLINLQTTLKRWVDNLTPSTKVAIVKFGTDNECATGSKSISKDCYIEISETNNGEKEKTILNKAIDDMTYMGNTHMSEALQSAQTIMKEEYADNRGAPGIVMLVTDGIANGPGPAIDDPLIFKPFEMNDIRVITLNLGAEIDTRMKTLVTQTGGKAFVSKDCAGIDGDAFQYASETFVPNDVGDKYFKSQSTSKETVIGVHMVSNGFQWFNHKFTIERNLNKEVNINMRLSQKGQEVDAKEFIKDVSVRLLETNEHISVKQEIDGFSLSFDQEYKNFADSYHTGTVDEQYTEQILEVYLYPKQPGPATVSLTTVEFETFAKKNFDTEEDVDYFITCEHPSVMEKDKEFKITSRVLRGTTPVEYANVEARIHVSRASDPNAETPPVYLELKDDGITQESGDEHKNDATYTASLSLEQLHVEDGTGISVMCNLVESPGGKWDDNNFFGKKRSLPTQEGQFTPYCCGTKDQKWNIPKTQDVTKLLRSSLATGAFLDPSLFVKDADLGPPARIADLKAELVGKPEEGLVKLSWTATGDDWGTGTAKSYNLVYSDQRKGLMKSNGVTRDSKMLISGNMEPVPAGEKMEMILKLDNHHVPGTYMFALNATDDAGKVSRPSNIARVNFHDGSPLVLDADPHLVHGFAKNDLPFDEKIRRIVKDERIVQRFMGLIEKNKKIVRDAENNVMEKRLKEKMGRRDASVERIMDKIKKDDVLRNIYKSKLL
jgi:hypothetical protein